MPARLIDPEVESEAGINCISLAGQANPRVLETMGLFPARVALEPELMSEWVEDGVQKQRWMIEVQPHLSG